MAKSTFRTAAVVLAATTALAAFPANAAGDRVYQAASSVSRPGAQTPLPPAVDVLITLLADLAGQQDRQPAWRNPQAAQRPSPDREFVFPILKAR